MARALEKPETCEMMTKIAITAHSVILYRSSPSQKADMVNLIKKNAKGMKTLAMGDGANDVNMIIQAHVGVGILSKEGNQASAFADYSIPEYQHLRRLLFWHGRPFGERLMNAVLWLVSNSMIFSICIFYLNLNNGFSGQQPIESMVYALINVNMTPLVILFYILFEVDLNNHKYANSYEDELKMPYSMSALYKNTSVHMSRFYISFAAFVLFAFYTGAVIFIIFYMGISEGGILGENGQTQDLFSYGVITVMTFVVVHHVHVAFMMRSWTIVYAILWIVSMA